MTTIANALTITEVPAKGVSTSTGPSIAPASQWRKDCCIHDPSEYAADNEGDHNPGCVAAAGAARETMHQEISRKRAQRHDVGMSEINLDQHAIDQREPECHQDVEASQD